MKNALELGLEILDKFEYSTCEGFVKRYPSEGEVNAAIKAQGEPVGVVVSHNGEKMGILRDKTIEAEAMLYTQAPTIPESVLNAIGGILNEVMEQAVANGANSVSMPDEYVEVAAWLSTAPSQRS